MKEILIFASILLVCMAAGPILSYYSCMGKTDEIGMERRFRILGGCQIKHDGHWIPLQNYRQF